MPSPINGVSNNSVIDETRCDRSRPGTPSSLSSSSSSSSLPPQVPSALGSGPPPGGQLTGSTKSRLTWGHAGKAPLVLRPGLTDQEKFMKVQKFQNNMQCAQQLMGSVTTNSNNAGSGMVGQTALMT